MAWPPRVWTTVVFLLPGARHRWMVEGQRGAPRRARGRAVSRRRAGQKAGRVSGVQGSRQSSQPPFHCGLCQLQVNSETQLKQVRLGRGAGLWLRKGGRGVVGASCSSVRLSVHQHMSSRRHKDRLAGKPPKHPKPPSPHSMLQKQAALAVSVLKVSACQDMVAGGKGSLRNFRGGGVGWWPGSPETRSLPCPPSKVILPRAGRQVADGKTVCGGDWVWSQREAACPRSRKPLVPGRVRAGLCPTLCVPAVQAGPAEAAHQDTGRPPAACCRHLCHLHYAGAPGPPASPRQPLPCPCPGPCTVPSCCGSHAPHPRTPGLRTLLAQPGLLLPLQELLLDWFGQLFCTTG